MKVFCDGTSSLLGSSFILGIEIIPPGIPATKAPSWPETAADSGDILKNEWLAEARSRVTAVRQGGEPCPQWGICWQGPGSEGQILQAEPPRLLRLRVCSHLVPLPFNNKYI